MTTSVNLTPTDTCQFFKCLQSHTDRLSGAEIPFVYSNDFPAADTIIATVDPTQLPAKDFLIEYAAILAAETLSSELRSFMVPRVELGSVIQARACSTNPKRLELIIPYSIYFDVEA